MELAGDRMTVVERDGVTTFTFDDKGTGRVCGDCQLCCKLLPVPPLKKAAGRRCQHQKFGKGCAIQDHKPFACRAWSCRWLSDPATAGMSRPDRSHYVIDVVSDYVTVTASLTICLKTSGSPITVCRSSYVQKGRGL
jgi:hypothetical protein